MEQLIFVGIILLFSMLEAVARKKRGGGEGPLPSPPGEEPGVRLPRTPEAHVPSYDQDASFDDAAGAGSRGVSGPGAASPGGSGTQVGRTSSEGLIPADVWEEIQAMARGGKPPARVPQPPARIEPAPPPAPAPAPPRAPARAPTRAPRASPAPMSTAARPTRSPTVPELEVVAVSEHAVHLTHAKYGKPVHDRLTGFDDHVRVRGGAVDGKTVRAVLRGGGAGLRQAILLQEILGPPVSLKDDPSAG